MRTSLTPALLFCMGLCFQSCLGQFGIEAKGDMVQKTYELEDFNALGMGLSGTVYIKKGNSNSVRIEAQSDVIDLIEQQVRSGKWTIEFEQKVRDYDPVKVYVEMDDITSLSLGGSGDIRVQDVFDGLGELKLSLAGSGDIDMQGSAQSAKVNIAGSGDINAADLSVATCKVSIAGSGSAYISSSEELNVSIAGSGSVYYRGRPKLKTSVAGSGSVQEIE